VEKRSFFGADLGAFLTDIQSDSAKEAHIYVGNPNQSEPGNEVAAPVGIEQLKASNDQKSRGYIVTKAVFTGEKVEELALINSPAYFTFRDAVVAKFANYLFMGDSPSNGSDGKSEQK
jgi:hypothetical protein